MSAKEHTSQMSIAQRWKSGARGWEYLMYLIGRKKEDGPVTALYIATRCDTMPYHARPRIQNGGTKNQGPVYPETGTATSRTKDEMTEANPVTA